VIFNLGEYFMILTPKLPLIAIAAVLCCATYANAGVLAAKRAAAGHADCKAVAPFYWEIGTAAGKVTGGSVGTGYTRTTSMSIASASKWLYGAYAVQQDKLTVSYLNFTSGYVTFDQCIGGTTPTVLACATRNNNSVLTPSAVGKFYYSGAHMQQHAVIIGLGATTTAQLGATIGAGIGMPALKYTSPQLAGGAVTSAADYATFLQNVLKGTLKIKDQLGMFAVPTQGDTALSSPTTNNWMYSIGHWVETPQGDGAYSSAGAFGFYPWIDATKTTYGVLAKKSLAGAGARSAACGAAIRSAYFK
jgi:hypothetical protein